MNTQIFKFQKIHFDILPEYKSLINKYSLEMTANTTIEQIKSKSITLDSPLTSTLIIVISNDQILQELNRKFRGLNKPTDVLSFSPTLNGLWHGKTEEKPTHNKTKFPITPETEKSFGEIIISLNQAKIQAEDNQKNIEYQLKILLIHGLLHLMGFDHEKNNEQAEMQQKEKKIIDLITSERAPQ